MPFGLNIRFSGSGLLLAVALLNVFEQAFALGTDKPLTQYGRQSWQSDTGLPQNTVHAVAQTNDGYIWMATEDGLVRFDGQEFRTFDAGNTKELPSDSIDSLAVDPRGVLWIGCPGGPVTLERGIFRRMTGAQGPASPEAPQTVAVLLDGKRLQLSPGRIVAGSAVTAVLTMPDGRAWVGTMAGLMLYEHGTMTRFGGETAGRVLRLFADREGALWVAFDDGVIRILPGAPASKHPRLDLPGVLAIFEDREGDMWFGTEAGGATVLREQAFSTLTTQDGLSDDFVRAVFEDHAGTVWIGTNRGGLNRVSGGRVTTIRAGGPGGLSSNIVLALAESGGDLWIGTPDGLSRRHGQQMKLFTTADGLPDDFVRSLYTDTDGSLWIGTRNGLSHYQHGRFTSYSRLDGLGSDLIGSILRGMDGTLWVGTLNGLSRFDGKGFHNSTQLDGLGGDAITTLAEDHDGTIWMAAHGAGLTRLRGGVFTPIPSEQVGLPIEIYSVLEDEAGSRTASLWLGSSKGVFRVSLADLNAYADQQGGSVKIEPFGVPDGMRINECSSGGRPAAWRMLDGSLWFATLKGAASVRPGSGYESRNVPTATVEEVAVDYRMTEQATLNAAEGMAGVALIVPAGRERLTIHYAAPSFQAPQKVRFRYMLEGFDHGWVYAGSRRTADYTNIPPGRYRFLVAASNRDGEWSSVPSELRIEVKPHFYRTVWFYLLFTLVLACIIYSIYKLRVRSVEASYRAVLAERNRIAREIHDTLAQGYVGISLQLEMVGRMLRGSRPVDGAPTPAEKQVEATKEFVRSSLAEARSSIWNLRSAQSDAEAETLPARLAATVRGKQELSPAAIRLEVQGSFRPVARKVEDELLRIGQESISNAVRHAGADTVAVVLTYDTGWLELTVSDDGKGFDPVTASAATSGHFGLQGMHERAAGIGARIRIVSNVGSGTTVEVRLALAGSSAKAEGMEKE